MGIEALRFLFTFANMHEGIFEEEEEKQAQLSFRLTAKHID